MRRNNNAKEHVKLYKSKKNWVAATIFTTALGITGVSAVNNVSANSVSSSSSSVNSASSSQVSSSSVKPSSTVTLRSNSAANSSSTTVKSSSAQSSSVAAQKSSLQNQINQKKQDLSSEQSQQSSLQNQYQKDSQAAQQASQNQASQINQINQEASSKKQAAQNTVNNIQNNEVNSQKSSLQNQINNTKNDLNNTQNQINSDQSTLQNKQNELNNLQNGGSTYNDSEGVVENVAHMNHNSDDYKLMFGPQYVSPQEDQSSIEYDNTLVKEMQNGFSDNLPQYDRISNNQPSEAQAREICEALMAEINATREAQGQQPFIMTNKMFNAVMERATQPSAAVLHHVEADYDQALNDNGVNSKDWRSENLGWFSVGPVDNVAQLINDYQKYSIFSMLNKDASCNWGHRHNFLQDYGQPVQASFGVFWNGNRYVLAFDVANYNGDGSDNLMNQVKDWENQPANNNEAQIESLKNDINNLQNDLNKLNNQKQSLQNKINDLNNQMNNVKFDENQLSPSYKQAYDDAQNILNTVDQWQRSQINSINSNSNVDALNKKASDDKAALDKLNNQIAQTKQEINDLENQLNALNNQPVASKPATTKPSVNTSVANKPATTSSVNNGKKTDDVLPGPDQIVVTPTETKVSNKTAANLDYNHGIDPLTGKALKDETPAQQQKAKAYVDALNKDTNNATASSKQNTPAESPVVSTTVKTTSSVSNGKKTDDVLPGPDQIVVTPEKSSVTNDKSSSSLAKKVVANISYNKGIDPLTNQLLSDETPAQRQKAKSYVESLNKTVAVKEENKISEPVYNQPITFSENKVKADNVKSGSEVKNELPTTGENQDKAATVLGIEAVSMGLALGGLSFLKRKKKH